MSDKNLSWETEYQRRLKVVFFNLTGRKPISDVKADSIFDKGFSRGCDTCGYGADEDAWEVILTTTYQDRSMERSTYHVLRFETDRDPFAALMNMLNDVPAIDEIDETEEAA